MKHTSPPCFAFSPFVAPALLPLRCRLLALPPAASDTAPFPACVRAVFVRCMTLLAVSTVFVARRRTASIHYALTSPGCLRHTLSPCARKSSVCVCVRCVRPLVVGIVVVSPSSLSYTPGVCTQVKRVYALLALLPIGTSSYTTRLQLFFTFFFCFVKYCEGKKSQRCLLGVLPKVSQSESCFYAMRF